MTTLTPQSPVQDVLADLQERAIAENDAVVYAALQVVQRHLPGAVARQPVPDVSGLAPFRPGDPAARDADPRGVNRRPRPAA